MDKAFYHPADHAYDSNHAFLPAEQPTWQEMPTQESMPFNLSAYTFPSYPHHSAASGMDYAQHSGMMTDSTLDHAQQSPTSTSWPASQHDGFTPSPQSAVFGNNVLGDQTGDAHPHIKAEEDFHVMSNSNDLTSVSASSSTTSPMSLNPTLPDATLPPRHSESDSKALSRLDKSPTSPITAISPKLEDGFASSLIGSSPESSSAGEKLLGRGEHLGPLLMDNPPRLRSDGVRKKNARFEIPAERKVDTIDRIILETDPSNEILLKELKQQKRLLRNRQAALDSRCRKKEHTHRLEEERKCLLGTLEGYEEELTQRRQQEARWMQEKQQWQVQFDRLMREKEELVHMHTLETANLRKQINFLREDLQRSANAAFPMHGGAAGPTAFSSTFSEFDHLSVNDSSAPWADEFSLINHTTAEHDRAKHAVQQNQEPALPKPLEEDKSAASGLLLMLLLCGAWVASKGTAAYTGLPRMPDDVRAASSTVLNNIYKDAGLPDTGLDTTLSTSDAHADIVRHDFASHPTVDEMLSKPASALDQLSSPTRDQKRDDAFSLSAAQYNALTTDDTLACSPSSSAGGKSRTGSLSRPRRNLQESLALLRSSQRKESASLTYTRSLLWDEVRPDIVRQFARLVGERNGDVSQVTGDVLLR